MSAILGFKKGTRSSGYVRLTTMRTDETVERGNSVSDVGGGRRTSHGCEGDGPKSERRGRGLHERRSRNVPSEDERRKPRDEFMMDEFPKRY